MRMSRILFAAKTDLHGITPHEQTIICRQLFAGHVLDSQPLKMGKKIHRMKMLIILFLRLRSTDHSTYTALNWGPGGIRELTLDESK